MPDGPYRLNKQLVVAGGCPNEMMDDEVSNPPKYHGSVVVMPAPPLAKLLTALIPLPLKVRVSGIVTPDPALLTLATFVKAFPVNEVFSGMLTPFPLLLRLGATSPLLKVDVPNCVGGASYMSNERVPPLAKGAYDPPTCTCSPSSPPLEPVANSIMMGTGAAGSVTDAVRVETPVEPVQASNSLVLATQTLANP